MFLKFHFTEKKNDEKSILFLNNSIYKKKHTRHCGLCPELLKFLNR